MAAAACWLLDCRPALQAQPPCVQKHSEEDRHRGGLWPGPIASLPKLLGVNGERKSTHLMGWPPKTDEIIHMMCTENCLIITC